MDTRATVAAARIAPWVVVLLTTLLLSMAILTLSRPEGLSYRATPFVLLIGAVVLVLRRERKIHGLGVLSPLGFAGLATLVMFGVVPLMDLWFNNPLTAHAAWWRASWLVLGGFLALYAGYCAMFVLFRSRPRVVSSVWLISRARLFALVLMSLAVGSAIVRLRTVGLSYFSHYVHRLEAIPHTSDLLIAISLATPAVLAVMGSWLVERTRARTLTLFFLWIPMALFVSGFLGARWRVIAVIVAVAAVWHFGHRRLPRAFLAVILGGLMAYFVFFGLERNTIGTRRQAAPISSGSNLYFNYLNKHEVGQFKDFVITIEGIPGRVEFQGGRTLLSIIPQTSFPTGGYIFSSNFFAELYSHGSSVPTPLPGELYMNFGVPGIFVGMLLFGALLGLLEVMYRRNKGSVGVLLIYSASLLQAAGTLRGDFTTFFGFYLVQLIPMLVIVGLCETRRVEAAEEPLSVRS